MTEQEKIDEFLKDYCFDLEYARIKLVTLLAEARKDAEKYMLDRVCSRIHTDGFKGLFTRKYKLIEAELNQSITSSEGA
jgi:hypothetical protein